MSSSRSDIVTPFVRPWVPLFFFLSKSDDKAIKYVKVAIGEEVCSYINVILTQKKFLTKKKKFDLKKSFCPKKCF